MVKYAVMDNEGADKWLGHEEVMLSFVYWQSAGCIGLHIESLTQRILALQVSMRRLTQPGSTWDVYRVSSSGPCPTNHMRTATVQS
jgi:hypothetical protein